MATKKKIVVWDITTDDRLYVLDATLGSTITCMIPVMHAQRPAEGDGRDSPNGNPTILICDDKGFFALPEVAESGSILKTPWYATGGVAIQHAVQLDPGRIVLLTGSAIHVYTISKDASKQVKKIMLDVGPACKMWPLGKDSVAISTRRFPLLTVDVLAPDPRQIAVAHVPQRCGVSHVEPMPNGLYVVSCRVKGSLFFLVMETASGRCVFRQPCKSTLAIFDKQRDNRIYYSNHEGFLSRLTIGSQEFVPT